MDNDVYTTDAKRAWRFTLNNCTDNEEAQLKTLPGVVYMVFGPTGWACNSHLYVTPVVAVTPAALGGLLRSLRTPAPSSRERFVPPSRRV